VGGSAPRELRRGLSKGGDQTDRTPSLHTAVRSASFSAHRGGAKARGGCRCFPTKMGVGGGDAIDPVQPGTTALRAGAAWCADRRVTCTGVIARTTTARCGALCAGVCPVRGVVRPFMEHARHTGKVGRVCIVARAKALLPGPPHPFPGTVLTLRRTICRRRVCFSRCPPKANQERAGQSTTASTCNARARAVVGPRWAAAQSPPPPGAPAATAALPASIRVLVSKAGLAERPGQFCARCMARRLGRCFGVGGEVPACGRNPKGSSIRRALAGVLCGWDNRRTNSA